MATKSTHRGPGRARLAGGQSGATDRSRRASFLRSRLHWVIRGSSLVGLIAALTAYVVADRMSHVPSTSGTVPAGPAARPTPEIPPIASESTPARGAFLGLLTQDVGVVPPVALAAYERAAIVMGQADTPCKIDWALLAAVGWVETQHGVLGGSVLTDAGVMDVAIFGPALSSNDSDVGEFDERADVDRPVGPLQFLPRIWSVVGVDADGDGRRDPQNINDAALGLAVFLCAGSENLSKPDGIVTALGRFNRVEGYAQAVLSTADRYRNNAAALTPSPAAGPTDLVLVEDPAPSMPAATATATATVKSKPTPTTVPSSTPTVAPPPTPAPSPTPTNSPTEALPTEAPQAPTEATATPTSSAG